MDPPKDPWRRVAFRDCSSLRRAGRAAKTAQRGFFDADERLQWLSGAGDLLERLPAVVDFELSQLKRTAALGCSDRAKGGRPPYDAVLMFRILVLQALDTLSDDPTNEPPPNWWTPLL